MFKTIIGLEIHVQLKTKSKMFCGCDNNAEKAPPNSLVCPVCLGLPGVLPVANRQAIEWTLKTGLALNAEIAKVSRFDRKHYFYPDLPKNYQISQYNMPFARNGELEIRNSKFEIRKIKITRIHLEEDAGKLIHTEDATLVDFNRAGTPLMEIVTEPEISSPQEAKIFLQELRSILRYLGVSDAEMEKGHLRCDANISLMQNAKVKNQNDNAKFKNLGTPVEIKNLNSFRMVERALSYEEKRQKEILERGEKVVKETRGWNDSRGETYTQRGKEFVQDYRYFPEPDIPPFETSKFDLKKIKSEIPELPPAKRQRYMRDFGLSLPDAAILSSEAAMAAYFEKIAGSVNGKLAANWTINELKMEGLLVVKPEYMIELLKKIANSEISNNIAKEVLAKMITSGESPEIIISKKGIKQITSAEELTKIIDTVLTENEKTISDYRNGKMEAFGFLVGQVMRKTQGQANPELVNQILKERIK